MDDPLESRRASILPLTSVLLIELGLALLVMYGVIRMILTQSNWLPRLRGGGSSVFGFPFSFSSVLLLIPLTASLLVALVLTIRRHRYAQKTAVVALVVFGGYLLLFPANWLSGLVGGFKDIFRAAVLLWTFIWITYWTTSKRVKKAFGDAPSSSRNCGGSEHRVQDPRRGGSAPAGRGRASGGCTAGNAGTAERSLPVWGGVRGVSVPRPKGQVTFSNARIARLIGRGRVGQALMMAESSCSSPPPLSGTVPDSVPPPAVPCS